MCITMHTALFAYLSFGATQFVWRRHKQNFREYCFGAATKAMCSSAGYAVSFPFQPPLPLLLRIWAGFWSKFDNEGIICAKLVGLSRPLSSPLQSLSPPAHEPALLAQISVSIRLCFFAFRFSLFRYRVHFTALARRFLRDDSPYHRSATHADAIATIIRTPMLWCQTPSSLIIGRHYALA